MKSTSTPKLWARLPRSYSAIRQHYRFHCMDGYARELRWFVEQASLRMAVARAAIARGPNGRRLAHQRRLPRQSLAQAHSNLVRNLPRIAACASFAELHDELRLLLTGIPRLASVYFYDTALRIGAHLSVNGSHFPPQVYLHQGSLEGAKKIPTLNPLILGRHPKLDRAAFPPPFNDMQAYELENLLCLYKRCLH